MLTTFHILRIHLIAAGVEEFCFVAGCHASVLDVWHFVTGFDERLLDLSERFRIRT
jgi:hypothetical protein